MTEKEFDRLSRELYLHFAEQIKEAEDSGKIVDIEADFMGFLNVYYPLSKIIPKDMNVVDLGCAYAPQSYYFREHRSYTGIDAIGDCFLTDDGACIVSNTTIKQYLDKRYSDGTLNDNTFYIQSYVPPWFDGNCYEFIQHHCDNYYLYYPGKINCGKLFDKDIDFPIKLIEPCLDKIAEIINPVL